MQCNVTINDKYMEKCIFLCINIIQKYIFFSKNHFTNIMHVKCNDNKFHWRGHSSSSSRHLYSFFVNVVGVRRCLANKVIRVKLFAERFDLSL